MSAMRYFFACFLLICGAANAIASPLLTNLRPSHVKPLPSDDSVLSGFASCDGKRALPKHLEKSGVEFQVTTASDFAYPKRIGAEQMMIRPNAGGLKDVNGKWLSANADYPLSPGFDLMPNLEVVRVGQAIDSSEMDARIGLMLTFKVDVDAAIEAIESRSGIMLRPRVPVQSWATFNGVWFSYDSAARSLWCWRRLPARSIGRAAE